MTNRWVIEKNLLDLEHNENLTKAIALLATGLGFLPTILFSLAIISRFTLLAISVSLLTAAIFIKRSIKKFDECKNIRNKIRNLN